MRPTSALALIGLLWGILIGSSQAQTYTVLHSFTGPNGPQDIDGANPYAGVIQDSAGNLYGTTQGGGAGSGCITAALSGCGTVFKLIGATETVLYSFSGPDGASPYLGLIRDSNENLYGATYAGGTGYGVVFKVDPTGKETIVYTFTGGEEGGTPTSLIQDSAGALYGTTFSGGDIITPRCGRFGGCGVIFRLNQAGEETVLHSFNAGSAGSNPNSLIRSPAGELFGTAEYPGVSPSTGPYYGTVFKMAATGGLSVLYNFPMTGANGLEPAGIKLGHDGNFYGTTVYGGIVNATCSSGCGVVFKLDTTGRETVLYNFTGGEDGYWPSGSLLLDSAGNLYGTAAYGGASNPTCSWAGCGVVFKLNATGKQTILHRFTGGADGGNPFAGLISDSAGNLYGTAAFGGVTDGPCGISISPGRSYGCGVVFKLKP